MLHKVPWQFLPTYLNRWAVAFLPCFLQTHVLKISLSLPQLEPVRK